MAVQPGPVIAVGNTATVHRFGATSVVKVPHESTPTAWALREADWAARVHAAGLPAPAVRGTVEVDGRCAIVFERVVGRTMLDEMLRRPRSTTAMAVLLAEVQTAVHRVRAPVGLPPLRRRLRAKIDEAVMPRSVREPALDTLAALPDGDRVCHGDLHPGNVLLTGDGVVIIDWFDVAVGDPAADLARTSLLVRPRPAGRPVPHLRRTTTAQLALLHTTWLASVDGVASGVAATSAWELPVAAARLHERFEHDEALAAATEAAERRTRARGGRALGA